MTRLHCLRLSVVTIGCHGYHSLLVLHHVAPVTENMVRLRHLSGAQDMLVSVGSVQLFSQVTISISALFKLSLDLYQSHQLSEHNSKFLLTTYPTLAMGICSALWPLLPPL